MVVADTIVKEDASDISDPEEDGSEPAEGDDPAELSEIEEGDIEALARQSLAPGESILGAGVPADQVESRGVCLAPRLIQKMEELEYKVPPGAKRVPWVDTMAIDGQTKLPKNLGPKHGVKLEAEFLNLAGQAVKEAYRRLRVMKVPISRPADFYAEMMKTDKQMYLIRQRAAEELRRIRIVEARKKHQAAKKFNKSSKSQKLQARASEKQQLLNDVKEWRDTTKKTNNKDDESRGLDAILDDKKRRDKHGNLVKSRKREYYDQKYGHGGKKKHAKSNTRESLDDSAANPWANKGKGKGKPKGKGKGKGKGKASGGDLKRKRRQRAMFPAVLGTVATLGLAVAVPMFSTFGFASAIAWHAVLMTWAYGTLMPLGRWAYHFVEGEKSDKRNVHRTLMVLAVLAALGGYLGVFVAHWDMERYFGYDFKKGEFSAPGGKWSRYVHIGLGYALVLGAIAQASMGAAKYNKKVAEGEASAIYTFHGSMGKVIAAGGCVNVMVATWFWGWDLRLKVVIWVLTAFAALLAVMPLPALDETKNT